MGAPSLSRTECHRDRFGDRALFVATSIAIAVGGDRRYRGGACSGFNGLLVGAAVPALLAPRPAMWFILVIGAAVSTTR